MGILSKDIILDEEAFTKAVTDFENMSQRLESLSGKIDAMLSELRTGFNSPAGTAFFNTCEEKLKEPLKQQKEVLTHISGTLVQTKQAYSAVFSEYEALQQLIKNVNQS